MMTRYLTLTLLVLTVLSSLVPAPAQAASPQLPVRLYPVGAHITYRPVLTNEQLDCLWGFFCEGDLPLYHFTTQDALHRAGGWGQFAGITRHGRVTMAFELFSSSYASDRGRPWSRAAFTDLRQAVLAQGYTLHRQLSHQLRVSSGSCLEATEPGWSRDDQDLTVMACWSGDAEAEAIVMYPHQASQTQGTAVTDLARQVSAAMRAASEVHRS